MKVIHNKWLLLAVNLLVILFFYLLSPTHQLISLINSFFYVSFIYILIWLLMFTIRGGFFNGVIYGFRKVGASFKRIEFDDVEDRQMPSERISNEFLKILMTQAIILTAIMAILLFLYYSAILVYICQITIMIIYGVIVNELVAIFHFFIYNPLHNNKESYEKAMSTNYPLVLREPVALKTGTKEDWNWKLWSLRLMLLTVNLRIQALTDLKVISTLVEITRVAPRFIRPFFGSEMSFFLCLNLLTVLKYL